MGPHAVQPGPRLGLTPPERSVRGRRLAALRGATLLAASTRYPHQAFRLGDRAWGLQFHIECDTAMIADWARDSDVLAELGYDPELVVAACDRVMADVEEVWQPFAVRFAALALGELGDDTPRRSLPLLGQ